jgi:hypothetical protein
MMMSRDAFRLVLVALAISAAVAWPAQSQARPYRGGIPWSLLLCKFSDSPAPPNDVTYYRNMTIASGTKGLDDYIRSIAYGQADLTGSVLHGWYTEAHTFAYEQGLSSRWQRVQDCLDTAAASTTDKYVPPAGQRVYVITSPGVDLGGWENTGAIGGDDVALPEIAHEFGHGVGLNHSWSDDTAWKDISWTGPGEYDNPWDLMSAANVYVDPTGAFGGGPPFLDGHHLDELGFLSKSRVTTLGVDGILSRTIMLAGLTHPEASGSLLARIPFDSNDRLHLRSDVGERCRRIAHHRNGAGAFPDVGAHAAPAAGALSSGPRLANSILPLLRSLGFGAGMAAPLCLLARGSR